jgi:hypothetical protein
LIENQISQIVLEPCWFVVASGWVFVDFVVGFCWVGGGYGWALLGLW